MGLRYTLRLYKGCLSDVFHRALAEAAVELGGTIVWNEAGEGIHDLRLGSIENVQSLYIPYQPKGFTFCSKVSELAKVPWIELRIQEGSLWDYSLLHGTEVLDNFSVCPQVWDGPDAPEEYLRQLQGQPHVLAKTWNIPVERIERYLVNWGYVDDPVDEDIYHHTRTGLAYPSDEHPYGDYEQFFDVLHTLGGIEPTERHTLTLPE